MNELPVLTWISLNILMLIFLAAIIATGQVAYDDNPKIPKWVQLFLHFISSFRFYCITK